MPDPSRSSRSKRCRMGIHRWGCRSHGGFGPLHRVPDVYIGEPPRVKECMRCHIKRPLRWRLGAPWA